MGEPAFDLSGLSSRQRLELIEELWDSLDDAARDSVDLTDEQRAELDRRLDALEAGTQGTVPAKELHARLRADP